MVSKNDTIISEFDYEFDLPNKEFTGSIQKSLKVKLFQDVNKSFAYNTNECFFEVTIPKYIKEFLKNKYDDYIEDEKDHFGKTVTVFKNIIRKRSLGEVIEYFNLMRSRALFTKEVETADKSNKVIFIRGVSSNKKVRDAFNFADLNIKLNLSFQYFVAYEMTDCSNFMSKGGWKYFGLSRAGDVMGDTRFKSISMPMINATNFSDYTKINWTEEREQYLIEMQNAIIKIQDKISSFVANISEDNIDKVIEDKSFRLQLLENKKND